MELAAILARREALRSESEEIEAKYPSLDFPDDVQQRLQALDAEAKRLREAEARAAEFATTARAAPGRPLSGGSSSRMELRVFGVGPVARPQNFDGLVLQSQSGDRIPVLEARHKLADFWPPTTENYAHEIGFGRYVRALALGPRDEIERRVIAETGIGATGSSLIPQPLAAEIIDLQRAAVVAFKAGARTIPMSTPSLRFARVTADPIGGWRSENSSIVEGTPAYDNATLSAKAWACLIKVSREQMEDAANLDSLLRSQFAKAAALALDKAILFGTGASNEPTGVYSQAALTIDMGTNGAALSPPLSIPPSGPQAYSWHILLDAKLALENANSGPITAVVLAPRTARTLSGAVSSYGGWLNAPAALEGVPILASTSVPVDQHHGTATDATTILLGNWNDVFVGMRTDLQISLLSERFADVGQVAFVLWQRADVVLVRPNSMARIVGIIADA